MKTKMSANRNTNTTAAKSSATRKGMTRRQRIARRLAKHEARTKAQTPDEPPRDIDELREAMARRIACFIANNRGYWRGCREPACRRQRSCCAPHIHCSNAPPSARDPNGRRVAYAMAKLARALDAVQAQRAGEEAGREAKRK